MSVRVPLLLFAMVSDTAFAVQAQRPPISAADVVLIDDSGPPPRSTVQSYSGTCPNGRRYALELIRDTNGKIRLTARNRGRELRVGEPTILGDVARGDLYAIDMHCGPAAAGFEARVVKPDGKTFTQSIVVSDRAGVSVYPVITTGHSG